jgi:hypothetical protein
MPLHQRPIAVVQEEKNGLIRHRWVFLLHGVQLVLERYHYETRKRKAQPWKLERFYDRHETEQGYGDWQWLTVEEVPWDEDLRHMALAELLGKVEVVLKPV